MLNPELVTAGTVLYTRSGALGYSHNSRTGGWTLRVIAKCRRLLADGRRRNVWVVSWNDDEPRLCGDKEIAKAQRKAFGR